MANNFVLVPERWARRIRRSSVGAVVVLAAGCGDGTGPRPADLQGVWSYSVNDLSFGRVICSIKGLTFEITQTGGTFTGTTSGGTLDCQGPLSNPSSTPLSPAPVVNGVIEGDRVVFDFQDASYHHDATLAGETLSGQVLVRENGLVTGEGTFTATRRR